MVPDSCDVRLNRPSGTPLSGCALVGVVRLSSRSTPPRTAAAAGVLLALALTAGCSAGSDSGASGASGASAPASAAPATGAPAPVPSDATPTPTEVAPPPPTGPAVQRLAITVAGEQVTGSTGTVPVALGQPVELTVTSDVADEVHVHGVDVSADVPAGGTVVMSFTQTSPGRFEVELEQRKRVLARLQVS